MIFALLREYKPVISVRNFAFKFRVIAQKTAKTLGDTFCRTLCKRSITKCTYSYRAGLSTLLSFLWYNASMWRTDRQTNGQGFRGYSSACIAYYRYMPPRCEKVYWSATKYQLLWVTDNIFLRVHSNVDLVKSNPPVTTAFFIAVLHQSHSNFNMNNVPRIACSIGSRTETFAESTSYVNNLRLRQRSKRLHRMLVHMA